MLGALKDSLASRAAKSMLAGRMERYGQLTDLRIRSKEKMLFVEVLLAGEAQEIRIEVSRYRITAGEGGKVALVIESISASREWLQLLLEDFVVGQPIPIPSVATMALGKPETSAPVSSSTSERPS